MTKSGNLDFDCWDPASVKWDTGGVGWENGGVERFEGIKKHEKRGYAMCDVGMFLLRGSPKRRDIRQIQDVVRYSPALSNVQYIHTVRVCAISILILSSLSGHLISQVLQFQSPLLLYVFGAGFPAALGGLGESRRQSLLGLVLRVPVPYRLVVL